MHSYVTSIGQSLSFIACLRLSVQSTDRSGEYIVLIYIAVSPVTVKRTVKKHFTSVHLTPALKLHMQCMNEDRADF